MMDSVEYDGVLKKSQHFQPLLKAFITKQVQSLLEELAYETGTESLVILANIESGTAFSLGSTYSAGFVETTGVKNEFLSYCMNRYHAGDVPIHSAHLPNSGKKRKGSPWGPKSKRQQKGSAGNKKATGKTNNAKSGDKLENQTAAESREENIGDDDDKVSSMGTSEVDNSGTDSQSTYDDSITVKMEPLSDSDISINQTPDTPTNQTPDTSLNSSLDWSSLGLNQTGMKTPPMCGPIRFVRKFPPKERTTLTLPEKILIIEDYESGGTMSQRRLADKYNISKSAVADMLKNRQLLKDHYEFNANTKRKRFNTSSRFAEINEIVWQWFKTARENGIQMSGPMIQEKALQVAQLLQVTDFKGSNGWLHSWRSRYNVTSYRDENAPPQKQTYINDYSKIEGFSPMAKEMEQTNAIMNFGSLPVQMGTMNDSEANDSSVTNEQNKETPAQSATETEHSVSSAKDANRENINQNYFNTTEAHNSGEQIKIEHISRPVDYPGSEPNEQSNKGDVTDSIDRLSNAWNSNASGENSEVKSLPHVAPHLQCLAGNTVQSTSSKAPDESFQSTAYESIVQNALSELEAQ